MRERKKIKNSCVYAFLELLSCCLIGIYNLLKNSIYNYKTVTRQTRQARQQDSLQDRCKSGSIYLAVRAEGSNKTARQQKRV